jgi:biopolymer transport protein ExbB
MVEYFIKGGFFMYPILLCSIVSVAIFLERLWVLRTRRVIPPQFLTDIEHLLRAEKIEEALQLSKDNSSPIARILQNGVKNFGKRREEIKEIVEEVGKREAAYLDRNVETLSTIASVSTLLGLLGTISGMIKIFGVISLHTVVNPAMLAGGISEALYTTSAGLSVAIPTIVFYRYVSGRSDALILEMEEYCLRMVELIKERQG